MLTEDFVKLLVGMLVSRSRVIVRCPSCNRNGALDLRAKEPRCVHSEESTIHPEGLRILATDFCEVPGFDLPMPPPGPSPRLQLRPALHENEPRPRERTPLSS